MEAGGVPPHHGLSSVSLWTAFLVGTKTGHPRTAHFLSLEHQDGPVGGVQPSLYCTPLPLML